jgi:hypothetical protein
MAESVRIISEQEFVQHLKYVFPRFILNLPHIRFVTGPGRSGAILSVYLSYNFLMNFVPYGQLTDNPDVLVVDTARMSGRTIRKASRLYNDANVFVLYAEPPRLKFWYEFG